MAFEGYDGGTYATPAALDSGDFAPVPDAVETTATYMLVGVMDGIAYGYDTGHPSGLYRSTDDGATWVLVHDFGPNGGGTIQNIAKVADGQVVVNAAAALLRSTGWSDSNPAAATWTIVATPTSDGGAHTAASFIAADFAVYNNLVLLGEYVNPKNNSRYLRLSTDNGQTFTQVLDLLTLYPADKATTHWHGVGIDPYTTPNPRLWATHGDGPRGVYYSDDLGATWTLLAGTGGSGFQMMTVSATKYGMVFTTDSNSPDGLYRVLRTANPANMALELVAHLPYTSSAGTLLGFGYTSWNDAATGWTYHTFGITTPATGAPIPGYLFVSDGRKGGVIWQTAIAGTNGQAVSVQGVGITASGKLLVGYIDPTGTAHLATMSPPRRGPSTSAETLNAGNVLTGKATTRESVAIGPGVTALGRSVVIGAGATQAAGSSVSVVIGPLATASSQSVVVGSDAHADVATNNAVVIGQAAAGITGTGPTAVGFSSSADTNSTAVGTSAVASGSNSVAVGKSASSTGGQSVAIGSPNTVASSANAIAIGVAASSSGTSTIAIGNTATAAAPSDAIAIGRSASAPNARSIALGSSTTTNVADQIHGGARHIALTKVTDPGVASANQGRFWIQDNGSGKMQMVVRFPTGAAVVLATEA